jgi:hypothetical protein
MESRQSPPQLRSLHLGEIFDRATTMYVRHFAVFSLIVLTLLAPLAVVRYFALGAGTQNYSVLIDQILHPSRGAPAADMQLIVTSFGIALLTLLLAPFVNNAIAVGVAALYDGQPVTYQAAFARVLRRWLPLAGTIVLCALVLTASYFAVVICGVIVGVIAAATFSLSGVAGVAFAVIAVIVAIGLLGLFALVAIACVMALYATTIEEEAPARAIVQAFGRIFSRREISKALLLTLSYIALEIIALLVSGSLEALIMVYLRNTAVEIAFGTIANAVLSSYVTILLAVYYYDVRTRAEGLDLEVDLDRLPSQA